MTDFFSTDRPVFTAAAPGRLDVMGGIADYSGSLLLQMPIRERTTVQLQRRNDDWICVRTAEGSRRFKSFRIEVRQLVGKSCAEVSQLLHHLPEGDWASYVVGCVVVLHQEKGIPLEGLSIDISSTIPAGKGVSSSAALEVAAMNALQQLYQLQLGDTELPLLAQKAENDVVGAPCGLMDQLSSYLGEKNKLLPIICQPHHVYPALRIPAGVRFQAVDSGIRHAVSGASYSEVRAAAFMGYSLIARRLGVTADQLRQARQTGNWDALPYKGFLANIPLSVFTSRFLELLPEQIRGDAFLSQYGVSIDRVTRVEPDKTYAVRACARHPVEEHFRIGLFQHLLGNLPRHKDKDLTLRSLGELMCQSHAGYAAVGLGNSHTDALVEMVREAGPESGVYGARVTGGGSGGAVVILSYGTKGKQTVHAIWKHYQSKFQARTKLFSGSSSGALYTGRV